MLGVTAEANIIVRLIVGGFGRIPSVQPTIKNVIEIFAEQGTPPNDVIYWDTISSGPHKAGIQYLHK